MPRQPKLHVIPGGIMRPFQIGQFELIASTHRKPPFPVIATLFEEDTWRVLSADPEIRPSYKHPIRLMTDLVFDQPAQPGAVLMKGKRWLAIVYDLDCDPPCREIWIRQALMDALERAVTHEIQSLAIPLLGSLHGCISWQRSLALILASLRWAKAPVRPIRIWLQITADQRAEVLAHLVEFADI